ncbi:molybdopterin-dependent oxidoreductase [uncultured Adlercreutzia sp.]|uniref:molybdopterin-containing oxidoreductase family protein n=1 Tax=uncultured Adlercreutzia sp. TaxID=875803 RepID=UPI0026F3AEDD|nr:molybdopterin-dependent oxidoreductase [uncultured Adlercreutzia sp.]
MSHTITRRGFVAASAAGAALAASGAALTGCASTPAVETAFADEVVNTQCTACPKQCGYAAYVVDGNIDKVVGSATNPASAGTLCARGYGMATAAASADRLTEPMHRNERGTFDVVSWDDAIAAIGEAVKSIKESKGPEALAAISDGTSTNQWYTDRLMAAWGSANSYTDALYGSASLAAGLALATGHAGYEVDYANAKAVLILGASTVEMPDPGTVAGVAAAKERGAAIIMADSRQAASGTLATQWLPLRAGTDLALVLAIGHELVSRGAVTDEAAAQMAGLDEWKAELESYTPAWAASVTGASETAIEDVARTLADAAPAAAIDLTWMALYGGAYANTGELARATALVNGLLGAWNAPGGVFAAATLPAWEEETVGTVTPTAADVTAEAYPLALAGSPGAALRRAHDGAIAGLFLVNANVVAEYPDPAYVAEAIEACELSVALVPEMTETAVCCNWILPTLTWAESAQLPTVTGAAHPMLVVSSPVIEPAVENAWAVPAIVGALATATGVEGAFGFTVEDAAAACCEACGCDYASAAAVGTVALEAPAAAWATESGLLECASATASAAGLSAVPTWVESAAAPAGLGFEFYRLTTGNQAPMATAVTSNVAPLAAIAEQYALDGLWINAATAADLGLAEGDEALIGNDKDSATVLVHVTEAIEPAALYLAGHYGVTDDEQTAANGLGVRQGRFGTLSLEPAYGAPLTQEIVVAVEKAGA